MHYSGDYKEQHTANLIVCSVDKKEVTTVVIIVLVIKKNTMYKHICCFIHLMQNDHKGAQSKHSNQSST